MSTATTTSHDTGQHTTSRTTTQSTNTPTRTLRRPETSRHDGCSEALLHVARLRKTLAPEERTTAARAFHADRELLSAG